MTNNHLKIISVLLYAAAGAFVFYGFVVMMYYPDFNPDAYFNRGSDFNHYVGGDAYNYIIMAGRSVGFILTGGVIAIISTILLFYTLLTEKLLTATKQENAFGSNYIATDSNLQA